MKYFLDFDGVIFDTETLKKHMTEQGLENAARTASLFEIMQENDPQFAPSALVFDDARRFLLRNAAQCHIVSSYISSKPHSNENSQWERAYQERKIALSGVVDIVGHENVHVVGASKAPMLSELKERCDTEGESYVFVDDRELYVQEALGLGIPAVWMNREGRAPKSPLMCPVVSFDEFEKLQIWNH